MKARSSESLPVQVDLSTAELRCLRHALPGFIPEKGERVRVRRLMWMGLLESEFNRRKCAFIISTTEAGRRSLGLKPRPPVLRLILGGLYRSNGAMFWRNQ